jgi:mediator of RNA polymerase II transcription subunit 17, fungi type
VDTDISELSVPDGPDRTTSTSGKCDLIYSALHALLLRTHAHSKTYRLGSSGIMRVASPTDTTLTPPPLLQPIIDLLQYQVFCERVKSEIIKTIGALSKAGISSTLRFDPVGETGKELLRLLDEDGSRSIVGGEAVLRIDEMYCILY